MDTKVLYMTFKNALGNSCTISIEDPKEDITEQQIKDYMDLVIQIITTMNLIKEKNIFQPKGHDLITAVSAKIVDANTVEYNLVV